MTPNSRMRPTFHRRVGFTLIELLVVIAIIGVILGLLLAAVQRARDASMRISCANNIKQLALACLQYHDTYKRLPPGHRSPPLAGKLYSGWELGILPFVEQQALEQVAAQAFVQQPVPFFNPPHTPFSTVVRAFICPADGRLTVPQLAVRDGVTVAFTSYLGNSGITAQSRSGVLYSNSQTTFADISDGMSNTLLLGERPPSDDFHFGWWYAGMGIDGAGTIDMHMGVAEVIPIGIGGDTCASGGPFAFGPGSLRDPCSSYHHWSLHSGGANFAFCDGSVHFLSYSANSILPALATRAGRETVGEL
jgi:prepilin-type N-terminal cleavage/methylation domain-containing protein/prepilin-type processing-associated H-X9-DG protein